MATKKSRTARKQDIAKVSYVKVRGGPNGGTYFRFDKALPNGKPIEMESTIPVAGGTYELFHHDGHRWFQWKETP